MSSSAAAIIAEIKQDVGRVANKIARGVAQIAFQDLQEAHSSIMECFYGGYSPVSSYYYWYQDLSGKVYSGTSHGYRRTGNLKNSLQPQGVTPSGKHSFMAKVNVSAALMEDYINATGRIFPAEGVFDLMWEQSIRGLPSGYIGHIEKFSISAAPVGVQISGSPDNAMGEFVKTWGYERGPQVADMVAFSV